MMKRPVWRFAAILSMSLLVSNPSSAQLIIRQDGLFGLYEDQTCSPVTLEGKVVKREFAKDALTVTGFVLEHQDGSREFINVTIPPHLSMAALSGVYSGLQRLLKEGRNIHGRALQCGATLQSPLTLERLE